MKPADSSSMHEAFFWESLSDQKVKCTLCPHFCIIKNNRKGVCGVRQVINGELKTLVYGNAVAYHIDPIEKKPIFHMMPGSKSFSIATSGCNMKCAFCQNASISQVSKSHGDLFMQHELFPDQVVIIAKENNCASISYTYTEPTIFFEYAFETAREAQKHGIKNIFVSNGYMTAEAIDTISPFLDAINIDLKSFSNATYKRVMGASLQPVLDAIKQYHKHGIWIELTTLIVPGMNDSDDELKQIAEFIVGVDSMIPWHISRFHPDFKMTDRSSTSIERMQTAMKIGQQAGLKYIYAGNLPGNNYESTYCGECTSLLIDRYGFQVKKNFMQDGKCPTCHTIIPGIELSNSH